VPRPELSISTDAAFAAALVASSAAPTAPAAAAALPASSAASSAPISAKAQIVGG